MCTLLIRCVHTVVLYVCVGPSPLKGGALSLPVSESSYAFWLAVLPVQAMYQRPVRDKTFAFREEQRQLDTALSRKFKKGFYTGFFLCALVVLLFLYWLFLVD